MEAGKENGDDDHHHHHHGQSIKSSGDTTLNYLLPMFFHGPFAPVIFFRGCFPNSALSLSTGKLPPNGLPVSSC